MRTRYELVPNQPKDWKPENLYYDVFEDDKWVGSRRLTRDEIERLTQGVDD